MSLRGKSGTSSGKLNLGYILGGATVLLACELPIFLALVGLGSLAGTATILRPPLWLEVAGACAVTIGLSSWLWRVWRTRMRSR